MASIFNFKKKEGKYFAPIVNRVPKYVVNDLGQVVTDGNKIVAGGKGVYAKVRLQSNATGKAELFAVNTEWFPSSN